ncbi:MAG: dienelactone hydrolase family protein [Chloroflexota bacterium]
MTIYDLHQGQPVTMAGEPPEQAQAGLILVHGRGSTAESILSLAYQLDRPGFAYLAPQAYGNTWYPHSFLAPLDHNEPALSSALVMLETLVDYLAGAGIPPEQTMLLGFSQGACLALEFVARHARRYGGVAGLSGGLIGPDGAPRDYAGSLAGTPIFLGCSDNDPHIPQQRIRHSAEVLRRLGAQVTERLYPGMGHTVNEDELEFVRAVMTDLVNHTRTDAPAPAK